MSMSLSKVSARFSRTAFTWCRESAFRFGLGLGNHQTKHLHSLVAPSGFSDKVFWREVPFQYRSGFNSLTSQWFGFSSSASPQSSQETGQSGSRKEKGNDEAAASASAEPGEKETVKSGSGKKDKGTSESAADSSQQRETSSSEGTSESDSESELSRDDLVKLVMEKEQLLTTKEEELKQMKDKVLRSYAEMENVMERTRRESENSKKFAIQNFAKGLLDVADNLGRASSVAKESFSKLDASKDTTGAAQQLKTLLEGVEMTEKQLIEVFKKFGLEKYNPVDEEFDPNRHNAVFQVPDASKPAGHVGVVLKAGYVLHDRVIRPAEVGVTVAVENEES